MYRQALKLLGQKLKLGLAVSENFGTKNGVNPNHSYMNPFEYEILNAVFTCEIRSLEKRHLSVFHDNFLYGIDFRISFRPPRNLLQSGNFGLF